MKLTADEWPALGFIALLIGLSIGARLPDRPEPIALDAPAVDRRPGEYEPSTLNREP